MSLLAAAPEGAVVAKTLFGVSSLAVFHALVWGHITFGAPGLVAFWVPVAGRKGGRWHVGVGRFFTTAMLVTAGFALLLSLLTLWDPLGTHPHLVDHPEFGDPTVIRDIFGWLMLYLAILTLNLTWYGWTTVRNKGRREANRTPLNLVLQAALLVAAVNCAWHGLVDGMVLMIGISTIGFATVATNLWFLYKPRPDPRDWLREHLKALVGTGISVYTAFFAFGAVRLLPEAALTPALWSVPLVVGLGIIFFHWWKLRSPRRPKRAVVAGE